MKPETTFRVIIANRIGEIRRTRDGWWIGLMRDGPFSGAVSQEKTKRKALRSLRSIIHIFIEIYDEQGWPLKRR